MFPGSFPKGSFCYAGTRGVNYIFGIMISVIISNAIGYLLRIEGVYESELEREGRSEQRCAMLCCVAAQNCCWKKPHLTCSGTKHTYLNSILYTCTATLVAHDARMADV